MRTSKNKKQCSMCEKKNTSDAMKEWQFFSKKFILSLVKKSQKAKTSVKHLPETIVAAVRSQRKVLEICCHFCFKFSFLFSFSSTVSKSKFLVKSSVLVSFAPFFFLELEAMFFLFWIVHHMLFEFPHCTCQMLSVRFSLYF